MALLDDRNFERDTKTGISIVKFYSLWSMESRALEVPFRQLSEEFRGRARFIASDINANSVLAKKEGVVKVPTIAIYINGSPVAKITNATKRQLREHISYFVTKAENL